MLTLLDGKKTLIGIVITELPKIMESMQHIVSAAGGNTEDFVRVSGAVVAVLGLVHKFLKDS